ncbi:hypothetical protein J6590_108329 [Homalodisca vitripennis]|nr:hypothetical protein J6590_108329 [Homalodisca vitripennis]
MNGVTVTAFDTGKVLDFECLSKFCTACVQKSNRPQQKQTLHKESGLCCCNYAGSSGGMDVAGAKALFPRSEEKLHLCYTRYLGDGDSKGFAAVLEDRPYGNDVQISKLECVDHVQKRVSTRLRRLKAETKKTKLADGLSLGRKGQLTNTEIDHLPNYYGKAIRNNTHDVGAMENAIWAIYYHRISSNDKPQHERCPLGPESWCKYNKALKTYYTHDHVIPVSVMKAIEPVFKDLSKKGAHMERLKTRMRVLILPSGKEFQKLFLLAWRLLNLESLML